MLVSFIVNYTANAVDSIMQRLYCASVSDLFLSNVPEQNTVTKTSGDFLSVNLKVKDLVKQLSWVFTHRKNDYLQDVLLLSMHPSVQIRRKIASNISLLATEETVNELLKWQEREVDRETYLALEVAVDKVKRGLSTERNGVKVLTVSEAITLVKQLISDQIYVIEGELAEVRPVKQMYYFALKDSQEVRLNAWVFAGLIDRLNFPLNEGLSVKATGKFKLSKDGRLYFDISGLELTGEGELLRNLKMLEAKLRQEGLFDLERKRGVGILPQKVLLIASSNSAALTDFVKVINQRRSGLEIFHLPIKTQGVGAEQEILEKLELANTYVEKLDIDTIVMTRGGGSQDDLQVFNSERVVRAVHGLVRPTIVAIGHERDTTLAELVADLRCSTPSQAAEKASLSRFEAVSTARDFVNIIYNYIKNKVQQYSSVNERLYANVVFLIQKELQRIRIICTYTNQLVFGLIIGIRNSTQELYKESLVALVSRLQPVRQTLERINYLQREVQQKMMWQKGLVGQQWSDGIYRYKQLLQEAKQQLNILFLKIEQQDPRLILAQGYAIVMQNNKTVVYTTDIIKDKPVKLIMQDGEIEI